MPLFRTICSLPSFPPSILNSTFSDALTSVTFSPKMLIR
uniref:Uncharacterized protein n=1 Tax=Arundo donax TaxID=35708 RepID=A0A0A8YSQ6_ARUDO